MGSMILSEDAKHTYESDQNEVLSYLPNYKDKRVLELGAGIGRFTGTLAKLAHHVTAVDFIQEFVDVNGNENGNKSNISFSCDDVNELDYPSGSFDLVFSNWLFMYLSDDEFKEALKQILNWLSPGGYLFLRESCFHEGGKFKARKSQALYRTPIEYCETLRNTKLFSDGSTFEIIKGKNSQTYIQNFSDPNQVCLLAKKVYKTSHSGVSKNMLDLYTINNILMGERVCGRMWYSTGAEATNRVWVYSSLSELCTNLALRPNQKVLDVGCGTGGNAFFMARHYNLYVHGIDLSPSMIHLAIERQGKMEPDVRKRVQFEITDILNTDFDQDSYDVIYSLEVFWSIPDKEALFKKLYKWLRPGGTIFFTDHCSGPTPVTEDYVDFNVKKRGYTIVTEQEHRKTLGAAGFKDIKTEDKTEEFIRINQQDLRAFVSEREAFIQDFSEESFVYQKELTSSRIRWAQNGQFAWVTCKATK